MKKDNMKREILISVRAIIETENEKIIDEIVRDNVPFKSVMGMHGRFFYKLETIGLFDWGYCNAGERRMKDVCVFYDNGKCAGNGGWGCFLTRRLGTCPMGKSDEIDIEASPISDVPPFPTKEADGDSKPSEGGVADTKGGGDGASSMQEGS